MPFSAFTAYTIIQDSAGKEFFLCPGPIVGVCLGRPYLPCPWRSDVARKGCMHVHVCGGQGGSRRSTNTRAQCSLLCAPCSMLRAPCSALRAPCSVFRASCSVLRAPCSVLHAPCSVLRAGVSCRGCLPGRRGTVLYLCTSVPQPRYAPP